MFNEIKRLRAQLELENEYLQEIDFSDVSISFEVVNDLRKDFSFILPN